MNKNIKYSQNFLTEKFFRTQLGNLAKNINTERSPTNGLYDKIRKF